MKRTPLKSKQTRIRKKSLKPLPKLKAKAWKLFSAYICKRDNYTCFTCGKAGNQGGHFKHGKLDFDEMNINCQCPRCNKWLHGNLGIYAIKLIEKYGKNKVDDLIFRSNQVKKYNRIDLNGIIEKLQ